MQTHEYTWKMGFEYCSNTTLKTNKALTKNTVIIDLYDGHRYRIQAIYPAKAKDKVWAFMPDTVVHTWPLAPLPQDELDKLRERAEYKPDEYCLPLGDVVFFPAAA
jgi:hypothetical protein